MQPCYEYKYEGGGKIVRGLGGKTKKHNELFENNLCRFRQARYTSYEWTVP